MNKISISQSPKLRAKHCTRMNRTFGCKEAFMCNISCPFWIEFHTEMLMNDKHLPHGEAFRLTVRESIDKRDGRKIFKEAAQKLKKPYPEKTWQQIKEE